MNQRRRTGEERSTAQSMQETGPDSAAETPTQSGFAPRAPEAQDDEDLEGEPTTLYDRLLRSGALDEVMEVAAQEQEARSSDASDAVGEPELGPNSEVVPAGTAQAREVAAGAAPGGSIVDEPSVEVDVTLGAKERPQSSAREPLELGDDDATPVRLHNAPSPRLPSVMLDADAAPRTDTTDRVVLRGEQATRRPSLTPIQTQPGQGRSSERDNGPILGLVALLCVTAGALVFWYVTRPEPSAPPAAASKAASQAAPAAAPPPTPAPVEPAVVAPEPPPAEAAEKRPPEPAPEAPQAERAPRRAAPRAPRPARAAAEPASAEPPPEQEPSLPEQPSRENVVRVMSALQPSFEACAEGQHGDLRLQMTVRSSGRVSHAVVQGAFEGTPAGSCLARAAREARFGPFGTPMIRLTYPVRL